MKINRLVHGVKGFVIPTKSFVIIGITKIFCYNSKMFSSINETFGCSKIFGCSNKKIICCPWFCCRNKIIFFRVRILRTLREWGHHAPEYFLWLIWAFSRRTLYAWSGWRTKTKKKNDSALKTLKTRSNGVETGMNELRFWITWLILRVDPLQTCRLYQTPHRTTRMFCFPDLLYSTCMRPIYEKIRFKKNNNVFWSPAKLL